MSNLIHAPNLALAILFPDVTHVIPITYSRTARPNRTQCDLSGQLQDTVRDITFEEAALSTRWGMQVTFVTSSLHYQLLSVTKGMNIVKRHSPGRMRLYLRYKNWGL
jgi:hypothetical protein